VSKTLLDPTSERRVGTARERAMRHGHLAGKHVALLDISKPRGSVFLDRIEELLRARGIDVTRFSKPTFTKPAPVDLRHEITSTCDVVIEALAD
jgi:hypothetical protein